MNIEGMIRSRIESILVNDARNHREIEKLAGEGAPVEIDPFEEERNLYQRIINGYRSAVNEVNRLLEENIGYLSGFSSLVEAVKDRTDLQDICTQVVDSVLQDFGAEYCGLVLLSPLQENGDASHLEGVCEDRKVLFIHSNPTILGSEDFEQILLAIAREAEAPLSFGDIYADSQFHHVDFPSVVRSLVCIPLAAGGLHLGALILSHSLPRFFGENHLRVLRILGGMITHIMVLTGGRLFSPPPREMPLSAADEASPDVLSTIVLQFVREDKSGVRTQLRREELVSIRNRLLSALDSREYALYHGEEQIVILMPGIAPERVNARVRLLQEAFESWKESTGRRREVRMNIGYSSSESGEGLQRLLQSAANVLDPVGLES